MKLKLQTFVIFLCNYKDYLCNYKLFGFVKLATGIHFTVAIQSNELLK